MPEQIPLDEKTADFLRHVLSLEKFYPKQLTSDEVELLFPNSGLYEYQPDDFVICQGDESRDLFIIHSGSVLITKTMGTAGATLATLKAGDIFGEVALVQDGVRVANAVAAEKSRIFKLDCQDIKDLMDGNPELCGHLSALARARTGK